MSVEEKTRSCISAVDIEPLNYHCSTGVMVGGGEARGKCVLHTVLNSGSGISIIGVAGPHRLQHYFPGLPTVYPFVGGPSMTVAGGRGQTIPQHMGVLTACIFTPWAAVMISLAPAVLPGVDDTLILGAKKLWQQHTVDTVEGLRAKAMDHGEVEESEHRLAAVSGSGSTETVGLRRVTRL